MADILTDLYEIVEQRKAEREEGSYTVYLFDAGLDKILKKLGEETSETIIAAKNLKALDCLGKEAAHENVQGSAPGNALCNAASSDFCSEEAEKTRAEFVGEVGDLIYHLVVMLNELGVSPDEVEELLRTRMQKRKNLKK